MEDKGIHLSVTGLRAALAAGLAKAVDSRLIKPWEAVAILDILMSEVPRG